MAFGGVGKSGFGRYGGYEGFKSFSNGKGVLLRDVPPRLMWDLLFPPWTELKLKQIKTVGNFIFHTTVDDAKKYLAGAALAAGAIMVLRRRRHDRAKL